MHMNQPMRFTMLDPGRLHPLLARLLRPPGFVSFYAIIYLRYDHKNGYQFAHSYSSFSHQIDSFGLPLWQLKILTSKEVYVIGTTDMEDELFDLIRQFGYVPSRED